MSFLSRILGFERNTPTTVVRRNANPALEFIKSSPQDLITETLIAAFRSICDALLSEAQKSANRIGLNDPLFVECILDLELAGGLDVVADFTSEKVLASAYVDAVVFDLTGKNPSKIPSGGEFLAGRTERYRGVAKYAMAKNYLNLPRPEAHLFGMEFSQIRTGNPKDLVEILKVSVTFSLVEETGKSVFHHFLYDQFLTWDTPSSRGTSMALTSEELNAMTFEELMAATNAKRKVKKSMESNGSAS